MANHNNIARKPGIAKSTLVLGIIVGLIVVFAVGFIIGCHLIWPGIGVDGFFQWVLETCLTARYNRIVAGQPVWPWTFWIFFFGFLALLVFVLLIVLYLTLGERKLIGWFQIRQGPNRVGPWGLLQPFADMIKLLIKEDIVPYKADHALHLLAPLIIFVPTLLAFVAIPFASGTVELRQEIVSPTFDSMLVEWIGPEDFEARGFDSIGFIEASVMIEEEQDSHKIWWIDRELDHEPVFIPTDEYGKDPDNRFRNASPIRLFVKPEAPGQGEPEERTYWTIYDYETSGRAYDILEMDWGGSGDHDRIIEIGLQGGLIDSVEKEMVRILETTGPDIPTDEQYDFAGIPPKRYFENLWGNYGDAIGINSRSFDAASMVPAFTRPTGVGAVSRDVYTPDWEYSCWMHRNVDLDEGKVSLIFAAEEFNIENDDWSTAEGAVSIQRIPGGGYEVLTSGGNSATLSIAGDKIDVLIGDEPVTIKLKDSQLYTVYVMGKDLGVGIIYILAVTSIAVLGIFMAGFGSNNKWSMYGAIRSAAQMISYEIPMVLAILGPVLMTGSLSTVALVESQRNIWFVIPQFLAFFVFLVAMTSEVNRAPFDLPEAESELVAGFHTEYSGLKFGFFFLAEYANMFLAATIMTVLFFGGWKGPFEIPFIGEFASSFIWFTMKSVFWLAVFIWFRATFPRFRIDHMMDYAWKVLLPIAMLNVIITAYFTFSDWNFIIWKENNWRIYNSYILPLFVNTYTNLYAIPIMAIVLGLLIWDTWGRYNDLKREALKKKSD